MIDLKDLTILSAELHSLEQRHLLPQPQLPRARGSSGQRWQTMEAPGSQHPTEQPGLGPDAEACLKQELVSRGFPNLRRAGSPPGSPQAAGAHSSRCTLVSQDPLRVAPVTTSSRCCSAPTKGLS